MITLRCHPDLRDILPTPVTAGRLLPEWLRSMPSEIEAPTLGHEAIRTLKHCPPILDALHLGVTLPLVTDLIFENQTVTWNWDPPVLPHSLIPRAPIGFHIPEQVQSSPFEIAVGVVLKFMNFWTIEVPKGWSVLCTHPLNRPDLPFQTLSGVVDCDTFTDGYVHFPALWTDPNFTGVLKRGTPIAQIIAFPRTGQDLAIETMSDTQIEQNKMTQEAISETRGVYRKSYRH